ncbi:MAG TPA: dienelactone hydrolase family protein [Casimicrobiaceae bacterium]|nr:dienelactone hydrolase family protein [Casimicrobiaceae bacterium]
MDRRIIEIYDDYTHARTPRRVFLDRLARVTGSAAAAMAMLPVLENNYARAAIVAADDARITTQGVEYKGATGSVKAYLALPKGASGKRGSVIVIHENRGLNPHIEDVTRRVAVEGFNALAPDLLSPSGGTPADQDKARDEIGKLDTNSTVANIVAAIAYLKARPDANGKVGIVGFCWGGGMVDRAAMAAPDLTAAVSYYGPIPPSADASKIKARMLLHYAGNDGFVNPKVPEFEQALKAAHVRYEKFVYEGAEHAFNNDTAGPRYNKAAADLAWSRTVAFLKSNLG